MTALTTHDALTKTIASHQYGGVLGDYEIKPYFRYITCTGCDWTQDIAGMNGWTSWVEAHAAHVANAVISSGSVIDAAENVDGRANVNDLTYAATALEGSADNGDRYCAARLRGLAAALTERGQA